MSSKQDCRTQGEASGPEGGSRRRSKAEDQPTTLLAGQPTALPAIHPTGQHCEALSADPASSVNSPDPSRPDIPSRIRTLRKLGLGHQADPGQQRPILIIDTPAEFHWIGPDSGQVVQTSPCGTFSYVQWFATDLAEARARSKEIAAAVEGDGHLWLCYPKATAKRYASDIRRDLVWDLFGHSGFEPVSQAALDDEWTAIRFRRVEYIRTMIRKRFATDEHYRSS